MGDADLEAAGVAVTPSPARIGELMETTLRAVEAMDIPAAEKQKIYLENAVNLLRLAV